MRADTHATYMQGFKELPQRQSLAPGGGGGGIAEALQTSESCAIQSGESLTTCGACMFFGSGPTDWKETGLNAGLVPLGN